MYSLRALGCKPQQLNPMKIGFLYKTYCQSQMKYGLEVVHLPTRLLKELNIRQNILLKHAIGLSKFCRTTPLLDSLYVDSIPQTYMKHKILFLKQISNNHLCNETFFFLQEYYHNNDSKPPIESYMKQLRLVEACIGQTCQAKSTSDAMIILDSKFKHENIGLVDSIRYQFHRLSQTTITEHINNIFEQIKSYLFVNFYDA